MHKNQKLFEMIKRISRCEQSRFVLNIRVIILVNMFYLIM